MSWERERESYTTLSLSLPRSSIMITAWHHGYHLWLWHDVILLETYLMNAAIGEGRALNCTDALWENPLVSHTKILPLTLLKCVCQPLEHLLHSSVMNITWNMSFGSKYGFLRHFPPSNQFFLYKIETYFFRIEYPVSLWKCYIIEFKCV